MDTDDGVGRDGSDTTLAKDIVAGLTARQRRFLQEYAKLAQIAPAARLAGVHRASAHRWLKRPAFAAAMKLAAERYFAAHRAKMLAQEAERARQREQRERDRRPQRRETLMKNTGYTWRELWPED